MHRLAQATALVRLFRESGGRPATSPTEVSEWALRHHFRDIRPTREDYAAAEREHPDLVCGAHDD